MSAAMNDLQIDWEQIQTAGDDLAVSLRDAATGLENDGLPPSTLLVETVCDYRHRLESFRNRIDPHFPAEQAAIEDRISHSSLRAVLDRLAQVNRVRSQLERVLTLRHIDDPDYAPLVRCREDARRLLDDLAAGSFSAACEEFAEGTHPLQALLTQLHGSTELSDDEWTELSEQLARAYGRSLATAVTRGRLVFGETPVAMSSVAMPPVSLATDVIVDESSLSSELQVEAPAAGGNAEVASVDPISSAALSSDPLPSLALPDVRRDVTAPLFQMDVLTPVDPDLHAAEEAGGSSFLDADCPFNPHSPSSSLTLALASVREQVPPLPATHAAIPQIVAVEPKLSLAPVSPDSSIFDDESGPVTRLTKAELDMLPASPASAPGVAAILESKPLASEVVLPGPGSFKATEESLPVPERLPDRLADLDETPNENATTIFEVESAANEREEFSVEELASSAAAAEGLERVEMLARLQVELLGSGRFAWAYQITRCLAQHREQSSNALPLWLVRALTLGEHVVFPKGNIALLLQEDFAEFRRELLYRGDREWGEGLGFFLRAAAIRPAVLAPASRGAGMLRAVGINENLCHLYNYCSRIIRFADYDQGNVLQLLRPNEYDGPRRQVQQQLLKEIEEWRRTPLSTGSPEVELLVEQLLEPILADQTSAIGWVRQEVLRLSGEVQGVSDDQTSRPRYMPARLRLAGEAARRQLREALQFANRWLELQGPLPMAIIEAFVPPALQDLRNSILDRHESAVVELVACDQAQNSPLISAGIAACRRAMQNVHDLFDPRIVPPSDEPDPRHILNGVLLKIPHISLNTRWESELELPALETELLEFLSKPEPSWLDVLELHSQLHDHAATERLLELDIWKSATQKEELRLERIRQIAECRSALEREASELSVLLTELSAAGLIEPQDQTGLVNRLERLSKGIEKVLDFTPIEAQFTQIRNVLERRRPVSMVARTEGQNTQQNGALAIPGLRNPPRSNGTSNVSASDLAQRDSVWVMDFN